MKHCIC